MNNYGEADRTESVQGDLTCTHYPLHSCFLNAALHITQILDVTISKHWNIHSFSAEKGKPHQNKILQQKCVFLLHFLYK